MIGERLHIDSNQEKIAATIWEMICKKMEKCVRPVAVSIAGESGSGKTSTAYCLVEFLLDKGLHCVLLSQDDYFKYPPRSNQHRRIKALSWVGPGEVKLDLLDRHVSLLKKGSRRYIKKPLVYLHENRIGHELLEAADLDIVVVEGTYTSLLLNVDVRVFIERDFQQTKKERMRRGREGESETMEKILEIEQREIAGHKKYVDLVLDWAT